MSTGAWVLVVLLVVGAVLRAVAPAQRVRKPKTAEWNSGGHTALGAAWEGSLLDWDD